jgi:serine protease inhibitor
MSVVKPDPTICIKAQNAFGLHLLTELTEETPNQNVLLSPTSVFMGLLLAELGASGPTGDAIRQTLYLPAGISTEDLRLSAWSHISQLRSHNSIQLSVVNALWADERIPLSPAFIAKAAELYGAGASKLDFSDPTAAETVNEWIREATSNLLNGIITRDMLARTHCLITSALYFAGKWKNPFRVENTRTGPFFLADGTEKQLSFVHRPSDRDIYRRGLRYEGAAISYIWGGNRTGADFGVLLPEPGTTPEELLAGLDVEDFFNHGRKVDLDFRMPKFTVTYSSSLRPTLERMGMGLAFRYPDADFALMGSPEFAMESVLHQSRLDLDEEGTVAAAQIIGHVHCGYSPPPEYEYRKLIIDRPFALMIRDWTQTILFAGVIYDPGRL